MMGFFVERKLANILHVKLSIAENKISLVVLAGSFGMPKQSWL